jgi:hypothetical protein
MREARQTTGTLAMETEHASLLTSISKAPARPHEVVAGLAEIVVDIAGAEGTGLLATVEDIGTRADGGVEELVEAEGDVTGIGVSRDHCQPGVLKR